MKELEDMAKQWDIDENEENIMATSTEKNVYSELCNTIRILKKYKFEPYQPVQYPPKPDYLSRLKGWIEQFDEDDKKYMLYLSSKIIFLNHLQITQSMKYLFEEKLKKIILEDIIVDKNLEPFSYKKALEFFESELKKTLFVSLSDSSRINDFSHMNFKIDRKNNIGIELETMLYPTKRRMDYENHETIFLESCGNFEKHILLEDELLKNKERLVILEDFCGSGSDIMDSFTILHNSFLPFKKIIFAPYIITYKGIETLNKWIGDTKIYDDGRSYNYTYGILVPNESKCFDVDNSYLMNEWHNDKENICDKIKEICEKVNNDTFKGPQSIYVSGYGEIKIAFVYYYNCPDNSLPIIWSNKGGWKPLFQRASRII